MSDPRLIATIGLPRSGKSTYCRGLIEKGYAVVNPDSFRLAIHGQAFNPTAEPFVWAAVYAAVDALTLAGNKVVVDATNITEERRKPWKVRGAHFILIETGKDECVRRAVEESDGAHRDLVPVIERMAAQWDWPVKIQGVAGE